MHVPSTVGAFQSHDAFSTPSLSHDQGKGRHAQLCGTATTICRHASSQERTNQCVAASQQHHQSVQCWVKVHPRVGLAWQTDSASSLDSYPACITMLQLIFKVGAPKCLATKHACHTFVTCCDRAGQPGRHAAHRLLHCIVQYLQY
jgi:hypothetical protein